ncbi:transketolase [Propionibacterium freudenreichii]|uniref:transketolase n=1 Tax=Propionibacterium freudenreichii TaxID=1744 RepID=UPI000BC33812|nr:transketolase [Propionibacterium freudenreichii]MDK9301119.1 transketolase [Propionibacterium freudenreichii]MDK9339372.1 transketolase [Propionibacterium freudenreichii]MDK9647871.1 transketolase [Propionibacterium freudenreichii]SBN42493.1 Transketolase [Propionibacterium freudenreichii]
MSDLKWTDEDREAVNIARTLAADAVEAAGSGHPGTAISLAPLAYLLYQKVMNVDPDDEHWIGRDRFLLSAGHASVLQYSQLYLGGLGLELEDLKYLRQAGSKTPGHPEYGHTKFVEATTGPLGAGISMAVGMAMAARRERGLYDPDNTGASVFDRYVYSIAGDGCMQEGVQSEAASLAGVQELGNLIVFYDDNRITIEGKTRIAFDEDVEARYAAYSWDVQHIDWTNGGDHYEENVQALFDAIEAAKKVTDKPSLIRLTTVIGWPLPHMAGSAHVHGAAIGEDEINAMKKVIGFPTEPFTFNQDIVADTRKALAERGRSARAAWDERFAAWQGSHAEQAALLDRVLARKLPDDLQVPSFEAGAVSTRKASGKVISALAEQLPELWGGSADLAGSNNTTIEGAESFLPADRATDEWPGNPYGRVLHFGIREHAMGGALNGINLSGLTRAFGGTFFVFADYMRPPVRLAALMGAPSVFVWTHDSVGVGEDGPTHQPVEHLASYRAIPGLDIVRPADANETAAAWVEILSHHDRPAGIVLTRQNVRTVDRTSGEFASTDGVAKGAYVLREARNGKPEVILIATGSEVEPALDAQDILETQGIATRVVSMPCQEWFDAQPAEYREEVLPSSIDARVSVEAGLSLGWSKYVGFKGASVSLEHYGASAKGSLLMEEFGFTGEHVAEVAKGVLGK